MKWGYLAIFLLMAIQSGLLLAQSQSGQPVAASDQPIVDRPFRRIFVPESEFPELPQDNLRPLEIDKLPAALDRLIRRNNESIDPWMTGTQSLRSMHSVAQLVGADLLSERTRLVWNDFNPNSPSGTQDSSARERLSPWNLAIENSFDELNSQFSLSNNRPTNEPRADGELGTASASSNVSPSWVFDSTGRPFLQKASKESWIRWSLKPNADSKPNRLHFEALVPRTVEGCLVLLLPKSARIEQSSVVTRKLDSWEIAAARLGNWPDKNPTLGTSVVNTVENGYWLLEISGQEKVAFTIELGTISPRGQKLEIPSEWGIDRLFSKQTLQYTVQSSELRIIGEWEWNEPAGTSQPVRLELPEGIKVRSVTINDREPAIGFEGNRMDVLLPEVSGNTIGGSLGRFRMLAEFLVSWDQLQRDSNGQALVPAIRNSNGAVLFGTTILQDQSDSRFVAVAPDRGRLESSRKTAEGLHRLEYSWSLLAPSIRCGIERPIPGPLVESIARLSTESERLSAFVKVRFVKTNDHRKLMLRIPPDWRVIPTTLAIKPQPLTGGATLAETDNAIQIDSATFTSAETTLEFQIFKELESGSDLELDGLPWISSESQTIRHCLYVEPNLNNRLSIRGRARDWILSEDQLTQWQRDSLPRLSRAIVFGTKDNILPPLVAESLDDSLVVPIELKVRRMDSQWRVEHRFRLSTEWKEMPQVRVHLPDGYQWYYEALERLPLMATFDRQTGDWTLQLSNLTTDTDEDDLGAIVAIAQFDETNRKFSLPIPTIRESKRFLYQLDLADQLIVPNPDGKTMQRKGDLDGYIYQWMVDTSNPEVESQDASRYDTLQIIDSHQTSYNRSLFYDSSLDLFVDGYGDQVAELSTKFVLPNSSEAQIELIVPEDWQVTECFCSNQNATSRGTFRRESPTLTRIVFDRSAIDPSSTVRIRLLGPKLTGTPQQGNNLFPSLTKHRRPKLSIRIPTFRLVQENQQPVKSTVWFPQPMVLENDTSSATVADGWRWPVWDWTRTARRSFDIGFGPDDHSPAKANSQTDALNNAPLGRWNRVSIDDRSSEIVLNIQSEQRSNGLGWIAVFTAFVSAGLFRRFSPILWFVGLASWIASLWIVSPWSNASEQLFLGIAFGGILYQLHRIVFPDSTTGVGHIRSDRSSIWDPKEIPDEINTRDLQDGNGRGRPLSLLLPWALIPLAVATVAAGQTGRGYSQEPPENTAKVFDILIPITDEGQLSGTTIYVPEDLLKFIEREEREKRQRESAAFIGSSKHYLRLDSRSFGFGNIDQPLTSTYEMWISESAVGRAVRIPFPAETLKLSRFSVDGTEVLSGRLSRSETELVWFPDRPGRRSVQIESQVRLRSLEAPPAGLSFGSLPGSTASPTGSIGSGDKRSSKVWEIASDVLPAGNATLEVETDGAWSFWVGACGRTINPSVGRILVHLGNKDRISGFFQPPLSTATRSPAIAMPSDPTTNSADLPVMNTELLLDHDQLIARTVIEFPVSMSQSGEVEIESDSQWLPIGTQWSDASLVDIRTGSTLDRRRYTLRWNPLADNESESSKPNPLKRSIVATWVPIGDAALRNILFAECRDRRVRQGVLRYSRSSGAIWTLDGISSWIPAINSKDRLDWPELKDPPLTTNLRIPLSGGFGVLRRQTIAPSDQLYATNRFQLTPDHIQLATTVKRNGLSYRNTPLIFEVPMSTRISRVISPSGSLEFATWSGDSKSFLQVFVDRAAESASEFVVESQTALNEHALQANPFIWPEVKPLNGWSNPPAFSLSADPCWNIEQDASDPNTRSIKQGQGVGQILLQSNTGSPAVRISRNPSEFEGVLVLRLPQNDSGENLQLYGLQMGDQPKPWFGLELSLPRELAASWTSRNPSSEWTSIRWNHRLLSIDPANNPTLEPSQQPIDFMIESIPEAGANIEGKHLEQIEINGKRVTDLIVANPDRNALIASAIKSDPVADIVGARFRESLSISSANWQIGRLISKDAAADPRGSDSASDYAQRFAIHTQASPSAFASEFWLDRPRDSEPKGTLEWSVPEAWKCILVQVNGQTCSFEQLAKRLVVFHPGFETTAYVQIRFCEVPDIDMANPEDLPKLASYNQQGEVAIVSGFSGHMEHRSADRLRYKAWMNLLENPSLSKGNAAETQAWRFGAKQFACLLSKDSQPLVLDHSMLDSQEFEQGVAVLSGLPWSDRNEYRELVRNVLQSNAASVPEVGSIAGESSTIKDSPETLLRPFSLARMLQSLLPIALLIGSVWLWNRNRIWFQNRPWWKLIGVAACWWLVSGDLWIPSLMALVGGLLVLDTYWMITEQFRRTGTRVPR